jgi:putative ABC transport system ATP-binding protein
MNQLTATDVSVVYGRDRLTHRALREVSIAFSAGAFTLLKGPSGSGKTTLLSVIGGLLRPTCGEVHLNCVNLYHGDDRQRAGLRRTGLGFVFQTPQLFPTLSARDNVLLPLDLAGRDRRHGTAHAERLLRSVGLSERGGSYPRQLSGGEQQRVAVARALASDPMALLADEPTAALDAENGRSIGWLLQRAAREMGKAVIVVSHDDRLTPFADRVLELVDGRIVGDSQRGRQ